MASKIPSSPADVELQLSTAIAIGATTFSVASANDDDGVALPSAIYCFTIDNGSSNKEYLMGLLNGVNVTAVKSVSRQGVETTGAVRQHRVGSPCIITDFATIQRVAGALNGTVDLDGANPIGYDAEPSLADRKDLATVGYVLDLVTGGTVAFDNQTVAGVLAGETVTAGQSVYLKESDQRWWLTDADIVATVDNVRLGIALGAGSAGVAITGGVLLEGVRTTTGLTAGSRYYLGNTAGALSTTVGTNAMIVGIALSTTRLLFSPSRFSTPTFNEKAAMAGGGAFGTPSGSNKFVTETFLGSAVYFGDGSDGNVTISSPTTLTRDMYYNNLVVTSTLTTNGFKIYVADTISGAGTIAYPTPATGGAGSTGVAGNGADGFTGTTYGTLLNTPGSGGGGGANSGTSPGGLAGVGGVGTASAGGDSVGVTGGVGGNGASRTLGTVNTSGGQGGARANTSGANGTGGGGGGGGASGGIVLIFAKNWTGTFAITAIGGTGGAGGNGVAGSGQTSLDTTNGGAGGTATGNNTTSIFNGKQPFDFSIIQLNQNGTLSIRNVQGAPGGGGGTRGASLGSGAGAGGAGGHGGYGIVFYRTKTWTGTSTFTGGVGGAAGSGLNPSAGSNGAVGALYEIAI